MADGSAVVLAQGDFITLIASELPDYGQYRRPEGAPCLLAAESDLAAVHAWLNDRARSPHTRESYYKEAARLYVWASTIRRVPLSGLTREDLGAFLEFVRNLPEEWKGEAVARRLRDGSPNPNWKPFVGPLSDNSIAQMLRVIAAMYAYWHKCNYIVVNPLAIPLGQAPVAQREARTERYLEPEAWNYLMSFIDSLPRSTWPETQYRERVRWIFHFAYLSGARVSELASAKMADFYKETNIWWLRLNGKGGKQRRVPVSDEFMAALRRYRIHLAMSGLPSPHEHVRAVRSLSGNRGLTPKSIYLVVKEVCEKAAEAIKLEDPAMALKLSLASTHWLRHTSASHRVNSGQDIRHVQKLLGHADLNTTMIYQHEEDVVFHRAIASLKVRSVESTLPGNESTEGIATSSGAPIDGR